MGDRRFAAIGDLAWSGRRARPRSRSPTRRGARSRRPLATRSRLPRPHRRLPRRRPRRSRARDRRLVARPDRARARRWTPTACSSSRANVLGGCQGTTGPASGPRRAPVGQPLPVPHHPRPGRGRGRAGRRARHRPLGAACSAARWAACGCSSGRSRQPDRVRGGLVLASTAAATADQIGWLPPQLLAIRGRPRFRGGDYYDARRGRARTSGWASPAGSRTSPTARAELDHRFGRGPQDGEDPLGGGPLRGRVLPRPPRRQAGPPLRRQHLRRAHRGDEPHDVGRGRGGLAAALGAGRRRRSPWPGVTRDRLYPRAAPEEIAAADPERRSAARARLAVRPRRLPRRDRAGRGLRRPRPGIGSARSDAR